MYNPIKPYTENIQNIIEKTWKSPYIAMHREGSALLFRKTFLCLEYDHTDGIGTKGAYHWLNRSFRYAVYDALAMNLNDLVLMRAIPYKLQNHIILPDDDSKAVRSIMEVLAEECIGRRIVITGGETSIQNTMDGMDMSITMSGFIPVKRHNRFEIGDALVGLASSGLHSNGFSRVRALFRNDNFSSVFIEPTRVYSDIMFHMIEKFDIRGMAHITGGAYTKLKQFFPKYKGADIWIGRNHKIKPHTIFEDIYRMGASDEEMYKIFNCGIGFIFSVAPHVLKNVLSYLDQFTEAAHIGEVTSGTGKVRIESAFSWRKITL